MMVSRRLSIAALGAMLLAVGIFAFGQAAAPAKTYKDHLKISYASIQTQTGVTYNDDEFTQYFEKKFNYEWDVIPLTWDNWAEKLRIWINSGDMPDIATWNYVHGEALSYIDQGLVRKLPSDWKTRWPNVAKAYNDSVIGPALEKLVGGTYLLPKPVYSKHRPMEPLGSHISIALRKDWAKAVGFPIKDAYTVNEILQYAELIKNKDPGKIGGKLQPINLKPSYAVQAFVGSQFANYDTFYKGKDGKYQWGPAAPETLAALKVWEKAYRDGLLNPEFYTLKQDDDELSFTTSGVAGAIYNGGLPGVVNRFALAINSNLKLDPKEALHIAALLDNDGHYDQRQIVNFWTATVFSPSMPNEKFERIMDIMNYVASDEGQNIVRMGFKDKDYKELKNDEYQSLIPANTGLTKLYPSDSPIYYNMVILSDDFSSVDPGIDKYWRDRVKSVWAAKSKARTAESMPAIDWTVYFHDSQTMRKVNYDLGAEYSRLVADKGDIEMKWRAWVNEKMPMVKIVIDELNAKK